MALVGVACLAAVAAPPAAADRMVAATPLRYGVEFLSAYNGAVVWGGVENGPVLHYAYFAAGGVAAARLPIASPTGGDIDLGPGPHGGTVAVYERCRDRTSGDIPSRCDIYRYGLASGRATPVARASSRRYDEHSPSVWGRRVAFHRARLDANGTDFIFAGPQLGVFLTSPLGRLAYPGNAWTGPTDLQRRTLVYRTSGRGGRPVKSILVKRFDASGRGRSCQVAHSQAVGLDEPQLDDKYVYWSRGTSTAWTIHRRLIPTATCRSRGPEEVASHTFRPAPRDMFFTASPRRFAVDGGRLFYGVGAFPIPYVAPDSYESSAEIWELRPVSFESR
jgi:hypothetical protein